jgi:hypothetical protein
MAAAWDRHGQPQVRTILTYPRSSDPTSPWYADQTTVFSAKRWITERFGADHGGPALVLEVGNPGQPS